MVASRWLRVASRSLAPGARPLEAVLFIWVVAELEAEGLHGAAHGLSQSGGRRAELNRYFGIGLAEEPCLHHGTPLLRWKLAQPPLDVSQQSRGVELVLSRLALPSEAASVMCG